MANSDPRFSAGTDTRADKPRRAVAKGAGGSTYPTSQRAFDGSAKRMDYRKPVRVSRQPSARTE